MVASSKWGKIRQREWLLDRVAWRGDERVLDARCGRGLLLCAAARRVPNGRAVGVDVWQARDQTGNSPQATRANAGAEGVTPRIDVTAGDVRALPFRDAAFDVVVSSLAIHNIGDDAGRVSALRELARVLKAGGRLLVQDIAHTRRYADVFREAGLTGVRRHMPHAMLFSPTRLVDATKP
jgi:ubiquinone/menaquinone biosynthesis C-methylase UbiE